MGSKLKFQPVLQFLKRHRYPLAISLSLIALLFVFQNGSCGSSTSVSSDSTASTSTGSLSLTAGESSTVIGDTIQFTASGGSGVYTFTVTGICGEVSTGGLFLATESGSCTVNVQDTSSPPLTASQTISIDSNIVVTPDNPTVLPGESVTVTASGGTPPYAFASLNTSEGNFTAQPSTSSATFTAGSTETVVYFSVTDSSYPPQTQNDYSVTISSSPSTTTLDQSAVGLIVDQYFAVTYSNPYPNTSTPPMLTLFGVSPSYVAGWNCSPLSAASPCVQSISLTNFSNIGSSTPFSYRGTISITGRGGTGELQYCIPPNNTSLAYIEWVSGVSGFQVSSKTFNDNIGNGGLTLFSAEASLVAFLNIDGPGNAGTQTDCSDFPSSNMIQAPSSLRRL